MNTHDEYCEKLAPVVREELLQLGISPKFSGYTYLQVGIAEYCASLILDHKVRFTYSALAKHFSKPGSVIVQSTRRAIHSAWSHRTEHCQEVFSYRRDLKEPPTGVEFITRVSMYVMSTLHL